MGAASTVHAAVGHSVVFPSAMPFELRVLGRGRDVRGEVVEAMAALGAYVAAIVRSKIRNKST